ncbi:eIF2 kinase IF2K-A (incomplete catalytic triad) [Toxoplasma gondii ARI]|uniref:eIF2 kinase IF2K-A (Incomplete catalytic triad) n=2 Tax=Toxoplasma gondii TaxID=5811 RepID=A0A086LG10_TOXGO|nr:eIF2 kinase IF2K-A (incomplete catalytic triad) [Toxoplasma gondii FOU]KYF45935.1 eIF2 kinase IF2K-A (incomplete catalytic triad) [Toxoplasma gondii ARI]
MECLQRGVSRWLSQVPQHIRLHLHPWYLLMKEMARPEPQHRPSAYTVLKHVKMLLTPPGDTQPQRVMLLYPEPGSPQLDASASPSGALGPLLSSSPALEPSAFPAEPSFPAPIGSTSPFSSSSSSLGAAETLSFALDDGASSVAAEECDEAEKPSAESPGVETLGDRAYGMRVRPGKGKNERD